MSYKLHLIVLGQPYVKKNTGKVVTTRQGRTFKKNSVQYQRWHVEALRQLGRMGYNTTFKDQKKLQPDLKAIIDYPVNVQMRFFLKTNGTVDLSNLYEGILDTLVEVGILSDDSWKIVASHDGSGVVVDPKNPRIELTITPKGEPNA